MFRQIWTEQAEFGKNSIEQWTAEIGQQPITRT
jgi:hypothetical protein